MERSAIESFLDQVEAGVAGVADVAGFVRELAPDELSALLVAIRARLALADDERARRQWAGVTAVILLDWAASTDFRSASDERAVTAARAAGGASEIFAVVLGDSEAAAASALGAGLLRLDPAALVDAWEGFGGEMDADTSVRLLRLITGSGDAELNRRYGPVLAETVAATRGGTRRSDALAGARSIIDGAADAPDTAQAMSVLEKFLEKAPRDDEYRCTYIELARVAGLADRAQEFLVRLSYGFHDDFKTVLLVEAAGLQKLHDGDDERFLDTIEAALNGDRTSAATLDIYMKAAIQAGQAERASRFLETVRAATAGTTAEFPALIWQGRLLAAEGRDDDAEKVWRRVRHNDMRCVEALDFYVGYHTRRADWKSLFSTLQTGLTILENDEDRVRVNREMAVVAATRLNKLDKAAEAYRRILAITPADEEAFEALVDLLEKSAKWHALIELFNERIRRLPPDDVEQKVALLFRIIDIYQDPDKLPSQESMLAAYSRISELSPKNELALKTLEAGYESSERWPDLLKVLQRKVEITEDPVELLDLFHRISEIAITRMSNEAQAIPFLEKILELDPQNLEVVQRLKTIYGHKHNQERQYAMLRRELGMVGEGPDREPILLAAAEMARDRLLRNEEALELYEEAYRLNGRCIDARQNLHVLYNRLERWAEYAKFLIDEIECQMPTVRRIELLHKLGEIMMDHLGDQEGAVGALNRVLEIDPGDEVAASRLERIHIHRGEFDRIYDVYKGRGEIRRFVAQMSQYELSDAGLARDLSLVLSKVCRDDLNDPARALDYLEDAFIADPASHEIGRQVVAAATARGDMVRVERTLKVLAANGDDPAERQADFMSLHDLCVDAGRIPEAFEMAVAAIKANPAATDLPALVERATETAEKGGLWQQLASLLDDVASTVDDPSWKRTLLVDLGYVYLDRLAFLGDARKTFERVLQTAPDDLVSLDVLERIVVQQEDFEGLESVLQRRLSLSSDAKDRQEMHIRLARLYEDLLGDDTKAAEAWAGALEDGVEPDRNVLAGLHRTLERLEMWERLAETIEAERSLAAAGWDRTRLDCELAAVLADGLGRIDAALGILDGVLGAGNDETALNQVVAIFESGRDTALAGSILQGYYQREGMTEQLLGVLEKRLERTASVEARAALLVQTAGIRSTELGDPDGALKELIESVSTFPTEENVKAMVDMAASLNQHQAAADTLEKLAGSTQFELDPALEAWIYRTLGELYGQRLGNPELALAAMEHAAPFEGEDPAFLADLLSLYRAVENIDSAMAVFSKLAATQKPVERRRTLLERAVFASDHSLIDEAVATLRGLASESHDPEADEMLEELLEEHGRFADLISHLVRKASRPEYLQEAPAINFRIASIYLDRLKLPSDAARYAELAVGASPDVDEYVLFAESMVSDRALRGRAEWVPGLAASVSEVLRGRADAEDRLLNVLRAQVELAASPAEKAASLRDIAAVECGRGNLRGCFDGMAGALDMMPDDPEILRSLLESAQKAGTCGEAVEMLLSLAGGLDGEASVRLGVAAAAMAFDDLGDPVKAAGIYAGIADRNPGRVEILQALDAVFASVGDNAARVAVLERIAALTEAAPDRIAIDLKAARLALSLGDNVNAARLLKDVVDRRADDFELDGLAREAAVLLVDASMATGDFDTAADMHILIGQTATEPSEMKTRFLDAAVVLTDKVNDLPRALSVLKDVLKDFGDDRQARDFARDLARRMDDIDALLAILDGDVRLAADDEDARIAALLEIAHVQVRPDVGNQEQALAALQGILASTPAEVRAVAVLRELFADPLWDLRAAEIAMTAAEASGDRILLMDVLRVKIRRTAETAGRVGLLRRLGATCVEAGLDAQAVDALGDAFAEDPANVQAFQDLYTELARQDRMVELVDHVRRAAAQFDDAADRNGLRNRAATVLADAGAKAAALELLQDVLVESPADRAAIEMTTALSRESGDWERYAAILRQSITHVLTEPGAIADTWLLCASVHFEKLNDKVAAAECWREVLKIRPLDRKAIDNLADAIGDDDEGLRELWKAELSALMSLPPADRDAARTSWLLLRIAESALAAGADDEVIQATVQLVGDPEIQPAGMDAALRIYRKLPDAAIFEALSDMLQERGENRRLLDMYRFGAIRKDLSPGPETCLRHAIEIEEKLRLHDFRFEDLGRLIETCPEDETAVRMYVDAGRKLGRLNKVSTLLDRVFSTNQEAPCAYGLALAQADILENDLNRAEDASQYLRLAFLRRPDAIEVIDRLAAVYERMGHFGELALLHENLAELTSDPEQRIRHYFDAYEILRTRVENPENAAEVLKKVLDLDPVNTVAVENLEAIARETGNMQDLAVWIGHRAELSSAPGERRRLRLELAGLLESVLNRRDDAVVVLDQLVEEFPNDEQAWTLYEKILISTSAFEALADMYMRRARTAEDDAVKLATLKKAASVYESRLSDSFAAVTALQAILAIDPADNFAFERLSVLLEQGSDFDNLVKLFKARAAATPDESERVALNLQVAAILFDKLDRPGEALACYRDAVNVDPTAGEARKGLLALVEDGRHAVEAALALEAVFVATGEHERLIDILLKQARLTTDAAERASLMIRVASVQHGNLGKDEDAVESLRAAMADAPDSVAALDLLLQVAAAGRLWRPAFETVSAAALVAWDDEVVKRLRKAAGDIAIQRLDDLDAAATHYGAYLLVEPGDRDVLAAIEPIYGALGRRDEQIGILRRRITAAGNDAGTALNMRLAELLVEDARDLDGAFELVRTVLVGEPHNQHAIGLMTILAGEPLLARRATDVLRRAFLESGDNEGVLKAVEAQIQSAREVSDLIEMHQQAAVAASRLKLTARELEHLGAALVLDPADSSLLDTTMDCIDRLADGDAAWDVLRKAAQAASWPDLEKKLLLTAVDTATRLGARDSSAFEAALRRVIEIDPTNRTAMDLLEQAFTRENRADDLIGILKHRLKLDLTTRERIAVVERIGSIYESRGDWRSAAENLEEAVILGTADEQILKRLRRCFRELGNVRAEIDTIERMASCAADVETRYGLLIEIARLQEDELKDVRAARATLERITATDGCHPGARSALEHIYEELEDWESLTRLLNSTVESELPDAERIEAAMKAASIADNLAGDTTLAISFARKAAQIDPSSRDANDELLRLYFKTEDWTSLVTVIRRKAEYVIDRHEKVMLLVQAAELARDGVHDSGLAAMIADEILAINPDQPEALLTMARVRELEGRLDDALAMYRRLGIMQIADGLMVEALLGVSRVLGLMKAPEEEVGEALKAAARIAPDHPAVKGFLKQVLRDNKEFDKLAELLGRAMDEAESDFDKSATAMEIARIHRDQLGDGDRFAEWAEKAWALSKDEPQVVVELVDYLLGTGNDAKAAGHLEWLVNYLEAKRRLKELPGYANQLGRILESSGDTRRAVEYYRICHEHDVTNLDNSLALARLHMRHNELEKATRVLQALLLRIDSLDGPRKREVLLSLAKINEARNDPKKARQFVTRLLSEQPDCAEAREMLSRL